MSEKGIIVFLLLSGLLQVLASDSHEKSSEISNSNEFHREEVKHTQSNKDSVHVIKDPALQFKQDYDHWNKKSYVKPKSKKFNAFTDLVKQNEIESNEYIDKYNKYGNTFNPNLIKAQEYEMYVKKRASQKEKFGKENEKTLNLLNDKNKVVEKSGSLLHDIDVNYVNKNKEISQDSEMITVKTNENIKTVEKSGSLLHDIDVNYVNKNKEISHDSEMITVKIDKNIKTVEKSGSLLHDIDVNYVNKNKEISHDSEMITVKIDKKNKEKYQENYQNVNELHMKRYKKNGTHNLSVLNLPYPPPANETILMARYIVHAVDWAALGTLSSRAPTKGAPFVCVKATSDGMKNESSGVPFFYMSPRDLCTQDLLKDNRVSVLVTLSETEYCKNENLDPQDPRCAKLTLSGKIKKIKPGSDEEKFAKNAVFSRHPAMKTWPADHDWYFTKLKIGQIILLDQFGGATYIKVQDYLNGKVTDSERRRK